MPASSRSDLDEGDVGLGGRGQLGLERGVGADGLADRLGLVLGVTHGASLPVRTARRRRDVPRASLPAEPGARRYRRSTMSHLTAPLGRPHPVRLRPPRRARPGRRARRRAGTTTAGRRPTRRRRARRARPRPRPRRPSETPSPSESPSEDPSAGGDATPIRVDGVRRRHRRRAGRRHRGRRLAVRDGLRARHRPGRRRLRRGAAERAAGRGRRRGGGPERAGHDPLRRRRLDRAASPRAASRSTPARPASRSSRRCRRAPCSASRR